MPDHVDVVGTGVARAKPDLLVARLGAETNAPDVASALSSAQDAVSAMAVAARAVGVADADLRTSDVSVEPAFGQKGPEGYRASLGLELILRDLGSSGSALSDVVAAGGDASRVHSVAMTVADAEPVLDIAREAAFADARHQAEQLAALAGRALGDVRRVSPLEGAVPFVRAVPMSGGRRASAVSVEPGTNALSVTVRVRFDLV